MEVLLLPKDALKGKLGGALTGWNDSLSGL